MREDGSCEFSTFIEPVMEPKIQEFMERLKEPMIVPEKSFLALWDPEKKEQESYSGKWPIFWIRADCSLKNGLKSMA